MADVYVTGIAFGYGGIEGGVSYQPVQFVPAVPSRHIKSVYPILTNRRISPYRQGCNDNLQARLEVYYKNRLINLSGIQLDFWLNYSGGWFLAEQFATNRYGTQNLYHSCVNVGEEVDCCLGYVKVTYNDIEYTSNTVRFNFIKKKEYLNYNFDIDAGTCDIQVDPLDRSDYVYFDAGSGLFSRANFFIINRMF